jgi:hypothetical protein
MIRRLLLLCLLALPTVDQHKPLPYWILNDPLVGDLALKCDNRNIEVWERLNGPILYRIRDCGLEVK